MGGYINRWGLGSDWVDGSSWVGSGCGLGRVISDRAVGLWRDFVFAVAGYIFVAETIRNLEQII